MRYIPSKVLRCDETSRYILYIGAYYCPFLHDSNIIIITSATAAAEVGPCLQI